jgi:hypothetical protein
MKHIAHSLCIAVKHNKFLAAIMVFFMLEALWIALTSSYPMAFDEDFHFGIIQIYAHHLNPFLSSQPPNANQYGAVFRDPSYLYQYLMSFPYRLVNLFTKDQNIIVIVLRLINIVLFSVSLPLYYKVLRATGMSKRLSNILMTVLVFVPVVPLMAAQINYDNLLLPLTALSLLLTIRFTQEVREHGRINVMLLGLLSVVCLLASLVQYEFLPIFVGIVVYIVVLTCKKFRGYKHIWKALWRGYQLLGSSLRVILILAVLLSSVLFLQRYGVNTLRYKTPLPACEKVLNIQACSAYGPWARNYNDAQTKVGASRSPLLFSADWFYGLWLRCFFSLAGSSNDFQTRGPLLLPGVSVIVLASVGLILFMVYAKRIFRRYNRQVLWFLLVTSILYLGALWIDNYQDFLQTGQAVAINGRYLVPMLLPIMVFFAFGYAELLRSKPRTKLAVTVLSIFCVVWGGGIFTYMIRSNDNWYWHSQAVYDASHVAQHILDPIVPGSNDPTQFLSRQ